MLGFVVIRGKKIVVGSGLNDTSHTHVAMASSFEVKAVVRGYQRSGMYNTMLSSSLSNHSRLFWSVISILAPLFAVV